LIATMSDPNNPNISIRSTPQWGLMQREMFWAPNDGVFQPFDTDQSGRLALNPSIQSSNSSKQIQTRSRNLSKSD
jgi:hypothetical protein